MKLLYGVTTAMVTPFDAQEKVNLQWVAQLTEFLIDKGVHCLYPLGTTGEMLKLSVPERKAVAETVVSAAKGRATVYIHVGAVAQEQAVELAQHAFRIGADGIGAVTPMFFGVNDQEMLAYYTAVARSVPNTFPVYLYNIPQCAANDLKADIAQQIADVCPNVIGIKYSYPDFLRTGEYLNINNGDFSVVFGPDRLFLPALAMGCTGTVSGVSCVYPEPFVALYEAYQAGDLPRARQLQKLAVKLCEALKNGSNMAYFKEGLKLRGIEAGHMKAPQLDLPREEVEKLQPQLRLLEREFEAIR